VFEQPVRALIFDMDGVLIDSNPAHRDAWEVYNRRHGVETTAAMHQIMYGKRNDQIIRTFLGQDLSDADVLAHGEAKEALYRETVQPRIAGMLVPGVRRFLAATAGLPLAVATNASRVNLDFILREAELASFFPVAVDGHQVTRPKPDPEIYLLAARLLKVDPQACVVFEDSRAGVEAGLAAGMRVVGISTTHEDLPGVSLMIRDFDDPSLAAWLNPRVLSACQNL
jgi:beta-phosphoglucomutase family hydrolase